MQLCRHFYHNFFFKFFLGFEFFENICVICIIRTILFLDNFEFTNPNYSLNRNSGEGEELNEVDTTYEPVDVLYPAESPTAKSPDQQKQGPSGLAQNNNNNRLLRIDVSQHSSAASAAAASASKYRREYAHLDAQRMGVPVSPVLVEGGIDESLNQLQIAEESLESVARRSVKPATQYRNGNSTATEPLHVNTDANSPAPSASASNANMAVDYSPHDFRQSFNAINQAAQSGTVYPGGGIRVQKQGDTTVVTEHRDPYSFYWQLDQARRREEPPIRRRDPILQSENVVEEMIDESTHVQSPDSHDSGIQVEYTRPSKPVRKIAHKWEEQAKVREESPRRRMPPGWERHEGTH